MRSSRLMAMVMLCRERERWTASELSQRLEVSVRTVYRDVAALQAAGVPLWTSTGTNGGIHLLPGWRTELDALTGDEAAALALTGAPTAIADLGLGAVALSAQLKVRSALPPELRTRAARIEERFHLDAPGWFHQPEPLDQLPVVADAVWTSTRLDLRYGRGERPARRRVDPLGLVMKAGAWYLVARHRHRIRTYRLGRIVHAARLDEQFERPADFDLVRWWARSALEFDRSLRRTRCRLALAPAALRRLGDVVGPSAADDAAATATGPDAEGWRTVELHGESVEVLAEQLLGLGPGVEVLDPPSLRERLVWLAASIAERNAARDCDHGLQH